jgi:hypothetical protein
LHTSPIREKANDAEKNIIKNILCNNEYDTNLISKLSTQKKQNPNTHTDSQDQKKSGLVTFTYSGREVSGITKLFRDMGIKVAFHRRNTIQNILRPQPQIDKHDRSGIYQMKCLDCPLKYVGQTGRTFNTRYKEHIPDIKSSNSNTGYSNHILNTGHTYGTTEDTMEIITIGRKGKYLNTLKKYHIYKVSRNNLHMNDTSIDAHNPIFEELHKIYTK